MTNASPNASVLLVRSRTTLGITGIILLLLQRIKYIPITQSLQKSAGFLIYSINISSDKLKPYRKLKLCDA